MTNTPMKTQKPKTSASTWFNAADGKRVRKQITGVATSEDWPAMVANTVHQLEEQGAVEGKDYTVKDDAVHYGGRFIMRPRMVADETGILTVRSKDYGFLPDRLIKPIMGERRGAVVNKLGQLVKTYPTGMIVTFTLIDADQAP